MAKVLVVEDDESLRNLYSKSLRLKNFKVETATDGADALVKVGLFRPDVIILDIFMPELDGIEVLKILKTDPEFKKIPILMLTSASEIKVIKECLERGATGYIVKGGSPEDIVKKINNIIGPPE
jgi:CheY-like chemotaxis protein